MKKIVKLCALLMVLAVFVSGCSMIKVTKTQDPATVLAEFTGGQVLLSEAQAEYEEVMAYYSANEYELDDEEAIHSIKDEIVHYLVENKVIENMARELGLYELSDEEKKNLTEAAEKEYEETLEYYTVYFESDGEEENDPEAVRAEVEAYLAENGYTKETAVEYALSDAWQNKLYEYVTADITAGEDQINAAYEELVAADQGSFEEDPYNFEYAAMSGNDLYWYPEGYRAVKHILIPFTDAQVETLSELIYELDDVLYQLEDLDAMENGEYEDEEALDLEAFGLEEGTYVDGDYEVTIEPMEEGFEDFDIELEADGEAGEPAETVEEEEFAEEDEALEVLMEPEDVPDEEYYEEYDEEDMPSREELEKEKARLTGEVDALKAEYLASLQSMVDEVLGKIAAGEDFEALIDQYGQDPGMQEEPTKTLGYFVAQGSEMWESVFTETAMKLAKPGDVSEPVVGTNGVHIIKFMRELTPGPVPLDDVRDACTKNALENSKTEAYDEAVETWVAEANVTVYHDRWN